jgi:hypothetical protein
MTEEVKENELNQIALAIQEEIEEIKEEELTEEEKVALNYIKSKIKNLEEFGQFAKVVHFYNKYYGLGAIDIHITQNLKKIFNVNKHSFAFVDKSYATALTFNVRENTNTIAYRVNLNHIKPLSKFLDDLMLNIHFPIYDILEILKKYMSEESASRAIEEIRRTLKYPVSVSLRGTEEIVMLIAPVEPW